MEDTEQHKLTTVNNKDFFFFFTKYKSVLTALQPTTRKFTWFVHDTYVIFHCTKEGTCFGCDGGGSGGGQFGALSPGFFGGGFFTLATWARGAGVGWVLVSAGAAAAATATGAVVGGGGAWSLGGPGAFGLENWTVTCSVALLGVKDLFAVWKEKTDTGNIRKTPLELQDCLLTKSGVNVMMVKMEMIYITSLHYEEKNRRK